MKIVFMGSPDFAIPGLIKLHESPHDISAVVSGMDKRRGRGKDTSPTPVKSKALELDIPVIEVGDLKSQAFIDELRALQPDLLVVVAFRVLPAGILAIPRIGSINVHASLLPKYRGAAPIHHAVMNGETKTGCTVFFLDEKVDTGKILLQKEVSIGPNETTGDIYNKLMVLGADLLLEAVNSIADGNFTLKAQDENLSSAAPKIYVEDCLIDFNQSANQVHNFIRGLSPYPAARTYLDGRLFKIYESLVFPDEDLKPRQLHIGKERVLAGCKSGAISLETVQMEGKPKSSAVDFFRGYTGPRLISFNA